MSAVVVRAMFRSHPDKPPHSEIMSRCIDACSDCVETCAACADACLSERDVGDLVACIRLNLDCAAMQRHRQHHVALEQGGTRQLLEAHLATCIAFCRACADECDAHGDLHQHCAICARHSGLCESLQRDAGSDADAGLTVGNRRQRMRQAQSALLVPLIDRGGTQAPRNKHNKNSEPPAIPPRRGSNQTWLMLNCDGKESNVGYGGATTPSYVRWICDEFKDFELKTRDAIRISAPGL